MVYYEKSILTKPLSTAIKIVERGFL